MNVPFLDLHSQYSQIKKEVDAAIKRVVDRQFFILGDELASFENEFAAYLQSKYVVGVGSGTDGLILALRALGIKHGDEVITPVNSYIATTLAITEVGATPIFVDVNPNTYQTDVDEVESKINSRTKAILPVHLYGAPCQISRIVEIAKKNNIRIIEDACQSHGATSYEKMTGTFGDIGVFSFYPGKNLGAYGDGGALCTNSYDLYNKLLKLRNYGQSKKYYHDEIGLNSRLDELQAAVLRVKLKNLSIWNKKRNTVAKKYKELLRPDIKTQEILSHSVSNYHVFTIEVENRERLMDYLAKKHIQTLIHYPIPIHLQKCYSYLKHKNGEYPHAEKLSSTLVSIPMYPELSSAQIEYIASTINSFIGGL